ncbi:glycoside hydrolase family 3 protein [Dyella nitratireducens]|uniref:Glucan 1,4-beta-glucosidase n=1 Tax=Dyella nitratireducens TaxID=1849580 RepID=A0ABQ1GP37_9GAMM|nr:exo 1,3/1,4-beta-D-glucan glucohydrolase [Dyella nitratireducens]GGA46908.1 glucan 1,4-beta-glucosidase [Dyella nitratireducens]GLQ41514.1 glucan 1,4-beta-glucosidase [Dyella nitratireducens]
MHHVRGVCSLRLGILCFSALATTLPALVLAQNQAASTIVHPQTWPAAHSPLPPDPALEKHIHTLLASMTTEEKVGQIIQADISSATPEDVRKYHLGSVLAGGNSKPGGSRIADAQQWLALAKAYEKAAINVPQGRPAIPLLFGIDAVHGNNGVVGATIFPHNVALGAAHDPELIRQIGAATAEEVRAIGLNWAFAPTLAVPQDVRWGRSYEGFSSNPKLVAEYAPAAIEGLQGKPGTSEFLDAHHVIASAKHFLGDGGTHDGIDQGDAQISEATLRDIHGAGYPPAIDAGVQTVMASFSSWNGVKMSANKGLLTDVLKDRMHFDGFVVGDWNSHGQVPGCSNEDCPAAINAGLDMYMAPDSWRGLYEHTLQEVRNCVIPMARLDDAVARVLRVKLRLGLLDASKRSAPSLDGKLDVLGNAAHRAIARQAVRESLVLLKNEHHLLPLDPHQHILVAGDGADNIPKQSGGWTLTWQGTGTTNANFPHAQSIWSGIREQVQAAGGTATLSADGSFTQKPDVAIVVFGEDPYAEFQGDRPNLAYKPGDDSDLQLLKHLHAQGIPVVAVFLSGRVLWMNPEIDASDAFVAAWLPGSEGGGIADVLLRKHDGSIQYDFHGKLSYAWPRNAAQTNQADANPLFPYGYGLRYADNGDLPELSEDPGIRLDNVQSGVYFMRGKPATGFSLILTDAGGDTKPVTAMPASSPQGDLHATAVDYHVQEDARRFAWTDKHPAQFAIVAEHAQDVSRQANGDMQVVATLRVDTLGAGDTTIGVACGTNCHAEVPVQAALASLQKGHWTRLGVPLKCLQKRGADMSHIDQPFVLNSAPGTTISIASVTLASNADQTVECEGQ